MKTVLPWLALAVALTAPVSARSEEPNKPEKKLHDFYPEIEPFKTGYLKVSEIHEIYYELCGKPDGKPVMVLHGGPGGGSYPALRRYHDPAQWLIVLHDQRGAGKSKPHAELKENETRFLVEDIEKLREHLDLGNVHVFGGSWGSTLGLAYAESYPQRVASLVLRGIFTCTKAEDDFFYHGGTGHFFPDAFEKLQSVLPHPERHDYPQQLVKLLQDENPAVRRKAALAWASYEIKIASLECSDEEVEGYFKDWDPYDFSLIENHYMAKGCFLEEGQLLRDAGKIREIPTVLVQGRYDVICPPITAWKLHKALPKSTLLLVEAAGHSGSDPRVRSALIEAVKSLD